MPLYLRLYQYAMEAGFAAIWPSVSLLLMIGLVIAILQAILQIEETTFSLLPKTIMMTLIVFSGGFGAFDILSRLSKYFITNAAMLVHQSWY